MAIDYLGVAEDLAKAFREKAGSVRVVLRPIGDATFPRSRAEVFTDSILTVTANDEGTIMGEYRPEQWYSATVYDAAGHIVQTFRSQGAA